MRGNIWVLIAGLLIMGVMTAMLMLSSPVVKEAQVRVHEKVQAAPSPPVERLWTVDGREVKTSVF